MNLTIFDFLIVGLLVALAFFLGVKTGKDSKKDEYDSTGGVVSAKKTFNGRERPTPPPLSNEEVDKRKKEQTEKEEILSALKDHILWQLGLGHDGEENDQIRKNITLYFEKMR